MRHPPAEQPSGAEIYERPAPPRTGAAGQMVRALGDGRARSPGDDRQETRRQLPLRQHADHGRRLPRAADVQRAPLQRARGRLSDTGACRFGRERIAGLCRSAPGQAGASGMNRVESMTRGITEAAALESIEIPSLEGKVSDEEWEVRVDLACAYRMVAYY